MLCPSVAWVHSLMLNDCDHLSVIDLSSVVADGSTCMVVSHDYIDPGGEWNEGSDY